MKTYTTIPKKKEIWGEGPWENEPDKVQWKDQETGLPCLAVRNQEMGHWCGYVGVPPDHEYHGKHYDTMEGIEIHGGLTFADACDPEASEAEGICHVADPGQPDHVWWLGFDCAHSGDWSPGLRRINVPGYKQEYRTLDYVQQQCADLARQLTPSPATASSA